jgi:hypothetical protein
MQPRCAASLAAAETAFAAHSVREDMRVAVPRRLRGRRRLRAQRLDREQHYLATQPAPRSCSTGGRLRRGRALGRVGLSTGPSENHQQGEARHAALPSASSCPCGDAGPGRGESRWTSASRIRKPALWQAKLETVTVAEHAGRSRRHASGGGRSGLRKAARDRACVRAPSARRDDLRFYRTGSAPVLGRPRPLASPAMDEALGGASGPIERSETARSRRLRVRAAEAYAAPEHRQAARVVPARVARRGKRVARHSRGH